MCIYALETILLAQFECIFHISMKSLPVNTTLHADGARNTGASTHTRMLLQAPYLCIVIVIDLHTHTLTGDHHTPDTGTSTVKCTKMSRNDDEGDIRVQWRVD